MIYSSGQDMMSMGTARTFTGLLLKLMEKPIQQAGKTLLSEEHEMIRNLPTPREAKFAGSHVTLRRGWDDIRADVMLEGLRAKFTQHSNLRERLLSTGDARLHENSPWDRYWGYANGKGLDMLGKLLMKIRDEMCNLPK